MFNNDFYPTPTEVIDIMLDGVTLNGKTVLEPSAGKGNIVDYLKKHGASVIACEKNEDLKKIVSSKCPVIANDFLTVESHQISHIQLIVMNPPFSADEKHILHAFNIAPAGCIIISLCNLNTVQNSHNRFRRQLNSVIEANGNWINLGDCFSDAERKTVVEIGLIKLQKPGSSYDAEFEGFFMDEEAEEQGNGIMPYNFIRDLVNRYIAAVKIYDEQLDSAIRMNQLTGQFFSSSIALSITEEGKPKARNEYKKDLQKAAWNYIFGKMNLQKYTTKGLKEDINKFVEQQQNIPFTMRNIYRMIEIVVGTAGQRMDRAIIEVFDKLTQHYHENRYNVEGWKTNSHYLINEKFIMPYLATVNYNGSLGISHWGERYELIEDLQKAICYMTGTNYDEMETIWAFFNNKPVPGSSDYPRQYVKYEFNTWYDWGFFYVKGFKKGTMHFKFKSKDLWAKFNQHVSRIKGYPLYENVKQAA